MAYRGNFRDVRPLNPTTYSLSEGRVTIGSEFLEGWFQEAATLHCVPLAWKRGLVLPPGHELEAWYVWASNESSGPWIVDPAALLASEPVDEPDRHLRSLIYDAGMALSRGRHRLSCPIFSAFGARGDSVMWLVREGFSVSLWTDFGFQYWFGRLGKP